MTISGHFRQSPAILALVSFLMMSWVGIAFFSVIRIHGSTALLGTIPAVFGAGWFLRWLFRGQRFEVSERGLSINGSPCYPWENFTLVRPIQYLGVPGLEIRWNRRTALLKPRVLLTNRGFSRAELDFIEKLRKQNGFQDV